MEKIHLFQVDNLLWLLPMIVVVYVVRYKAVANATGKKEGN